MKMIIDTDPGVDDAMAIFYAALVPEIELIGLTSIFGNVTVETATRNALRLLEIAGIDAPVAQGAARPLARPYNAPSSYVHGVEGFGDVPAHTPKTKAIKEPADAFLCRMAREHKGELVVCAIGPITNVANAITRDPEFAHNVKQIVFMGGAANVPGNISTHAEANTFNDPHALNIVINSGADVVMVGLDVTMQVLLTADDFMDLAKANPKLGGFLQDASHFYLDFYKQIAKEDGCGLHDPAAVIAATHPDMFEIKPLALEVVEEGDEIGRTRPASDAGYPKIGVCVDGDIQAVKDKFIAAFAS